MNKTLAQKIESAIPTEYAGNLITMSVTADLNGTKIRVWYHPNYAHQRGCWLDGADSANLVPKDGDILTVRSAGSMYPNRSWDWTKKYVVWNENLTPIQTP